MSTRIRIKWKRGELNATIEDTPTGRAVIEALPLESRACTWGEEVYFNVPVRAKRVACASRTTRACARRTTQRAHGAQPNVRTAHNPTCARRTLRTATCSVASRAISGCWARFALET
ncbi:MAG: hypothetical protein A3H32_13680 [Betaproteobacteria bacterium RIFCSPLOWO2_02_FULL_63_19]|nr:MAG: hypothetical protein A3H32_13680 [Betaproteobacteria bacterium RIFCSPLOWO2_02_FULL_63_19]